MSRRGLGEIGRVNSRLSLRMVVDNGMRLNGVESVFIDRVGGDKA